MNNLLQLKLQLASVDSQVSTGKHKTPGDVCNSLFKNLLKKESDASQDGDLGLGLFEGGGSVETLPGIEPKRTLRTLKENNHLMHLQKMEKKGLTHNERDLKRAELIRDKLGG